MAVAAFVAVLSAPDDAAFFFLSSFCEFFVFDSAAVFYGHFGWFVRLFV